jgi:tight adherence protein B
MQLNAIVYVLVFVAAFLAAEGLLSLLGGARGRRREQTGARLKQLAARLTDPAASSAEGSLLRGLAGRGLLEWISNLIPARTKLDLLLYRAGSTTPASRFVGISLVIALGAFSATTVLLDSNAAGLVAALLGLIPLGLLMRQATRRMRLFEEQFPEALELMTRALRAGNSLSFAFQFAGEELPDPIGTEFGQVSEELKLGQDVTTALSNLTYRIDAGDLPYFATAILIQRETGGNLAELLDSLGYVIRERFKLFARIKSLTSVGRATANILGVWPLGLVGLLTLTGTTFIQSLWTTPQGHIMVAIAAGLIVLGYWLCRRAAIIEV